MKTTYNGIQVLRFLAVALVVWAHSIDAFLKQLGDRSLNPFGEMENFGAVGVDVFFCY
jgi:exopolysaccharide production protein ExoZ